MPKTKVVFFDAGGTLFRPYPSVGDIYARVALEHGVRVDAARVEKIFHEKWHERNGMVTLASLSSDKIEREWWYRLVREVFENPLLPSPPSISHSSFPAAAGGESTPPPVGGGAMDPRPETAGDDEKSNDGSPFKDFDAFFHELYDLFARAESWRLFDDTIPALQELRRRHFRLGIISNWDHRLFSIVEQLGLTSYFDQVTASSAVGSAKPGKKIFETALMRMKASSHESLHVGDSLEDDYWGARRADLRAVLLSRHPRRSLAGDPWIPRQRPRGMTNGGHSVTAASQKYNDVVTIHSLNDLLKLLS